MKQPLSEQFRKMQKLAGIITESYADYYNEQEKYFEELEAAVNSGRATPEESKMYDEWVKAREEGGGASAPMFESNGQKFTDAQIKGIEQTLGLLNWMKSLSVEGPNGPFSRNVEDFLSVAKDVFEAAIGEPLYINDKIDIK